MVNKKELERAIDWQMRHGIETTAVVVSKARYNELKGWWKCKRTAMKWTGRKWPGLEVLKPWPKHVKIKYLASGLPWPWPWPPGT